MSDFKVQVKGLKELNRALKAVDKEAPKGIRVALNGCSELLIRETKPLIPRRTGRAAGSLKASSTRGEVRIKVGGPRAAYYPWLDFGGRVGVKKSVIRPFIQEGRYLYPTLRKNRAKFEALLGSSLADVAKRAGLDVD